MLPLAIALEEGRFDGPLARACAGVWGRFSARAVVRPLAIPSGVRAVAIGGSTLGGSGKTPLAIATVLEIAATGARVALVGHAHRARPGRVRTVACDDHPSEVGDEALVAARALARCGAFVVVAPRRSEAMAHAARHADVLVLDGVAQTAPTPASLALLALDAEEPWGRACALPPLGDLRAPRDALFKACDGLVWINDHDDAPHAPTGGVVAPTTAPHTGKQQWSARLLSSGARIGRELWTWDDLAGVRVGLLCALARPERLVRSISSRGISLQCLLRAPDHGPASKELIASAARARVSLGIDVWLATAKCAIHFSLPSSGRSADTVGSVLGAPLAVIDARLSLLPALRERVRLLGAP